LIYDEACRVCSAARAWIDRRAAAEAFEFLACQDPERARRFPMVSEAACMEAMQLVLPDGRVLAGDRAIPEILRRLRRWRWLGALFALPGAARLAAGVYAWIARNRYAISTALPLGT
jgi:predicted DCC family thiol-disulfide oxidoreductase YuxK